MIRAKRKSKTTAICPDCGKQHRIHKVSQGEYIKGCIYPCCVYWVEDRPPVLSPEQIRAAIAVYILVPEPVITERDLDVGSIVAQAQLEVDVKWYS